MLEKDDVNALREIFVSRNECNRMSDNLKHDVNALSGDLREVKTKLNMLISILGAIGVAVLGIAAKMLFGT